jgi:hypothetical protein
MDMNRTLGKDKVRRRRGPLKSWLLAGGLQGSGVFRECPISF